MPARARRPLLSNFPETRLYVESARREQREGGGGRASECGNLPHGGASLRVARFPDRDAPVSGSVEKCIFRRLIPRIQRGRFVSPITRLLGSLFPGKTSARNAEEEAANRLNRPTIKFIDLPHDYLSDISSEDGAPDDNRVCRSVCWRACFKLLRQIAGANSGADAGQTVPDRASLAKLQVH